MVQAKPAGRNPRLDRSRHHSAPHHLLPPEVRQTVLLWTEQTKSRRSQIAHHHYDPVQRARAADPKLDGRQARQAQLGTTAHVQLCRTPPARVQPSV